MWVVIYNYCPLLRWTSRIVIPENNPSHGDSSGCPPCERAIIVLLYRIDRKKHIKNANTLIEKE